MRNVTAAIARRIARHRYWRCLNTSRRRIDFIALASAGSLVTLLVTMDGRGHTPFSTMMRQPVALREAEAPPVMSKTQSSNKHTPTVRLPIWHRRIGTMSVYFPNSVRPLFGAGSRGLGKK